MISSVAGTVLVRRPDHVVVECDGVGYRLEVSAQSLKAVPAAGKQAQLLTQMIVRDDSICLYGFASEEERELFLMLISVGGVGPKVAMAILSGSASRELMAAIAKGDAKRFQAVPGVGKKTAERIIVDLREKVSAGLPESGLPAGAGEDPRLLAREGLVGLGYTIAEADSLLDGVAAKGTTAEELIAGALRTAAAPKKTASNSLAESQ